MFIKVVDVKVYVVLMLVLVITSCSNTQLTQSWKEDKLAKSYQHPMIIGISDSQQTRRIYEGHLVAELKKKNITAIPSYTLISSKQKINRETIIKAIQGSDIDSVLVTYLVSAESELKEVDSPLTGNYSGDTENNMMSATIITSKGRLSSEDVIVLKHDYFDAGSKSIVWSVQTRTVAPQSIDQAIEEVTALLVELLLDDEILK